MMQVLADILERHESEPSATQAIRDELASAESLHVLGAIWADVIEMINQRRHVGLFDELTATGALTPKQRQQLAGDPATGPLRRLLRGPELAGCDLRTVLANAIGER